MLEDQKSHIQIWYLLHIRQHTMTQSHTFAEIDHEIISMAILLPSSDSRKVVVSYKRKYVHEALVNCLVKLAHEKKCG